MVDEAKKSGEEQEESVIVMRRTEVRKPQILFGPFVMKASIFTLSNKSAVDQLLLDP